MTLLVLAREELARLLTIDDHIAAAETAFRLLGEGKADLPPPLHIGADGGAFHAKGGALPLARRYVAIKVNGNFPGNPERFGLPTIQGAILLLDGERGSPLALMDSVGMTAARTAAATALAARHLARPNSATVTICGCGAQAHDQLAYLARILPLTRAHVWDLDEDRAEQFAGRMAADLGMAVSPAGDLGVAARESDVIVTCTTARDPFLRLEHVAPGTFVAAVGADNPDKQELGPALLANARLFTDLTAQCEHMGELHHAIRTGAVGTTHVAGELAELVCGRKAGRQSEDEIIIFDSTGIAVQDVAAAAIAYERALENGSGTAVALG